VRIGLVCPYSLDVPGGVQNHVQELAAALAGRGHHVGVLAPGDRATVRPAHVETVGRAVPTRFNGAVGRVAFGPRVLAQTRRWLRAGNYDVVHVHEPEAPSVSLLALWASSTTVVATFHTANAGSLLLSAAGIALRPSLEKLSARVAVSEVAHDTLVQHLGGNAVVISNGIDCGYFGAASPRAEWTSPGPTIVFLGRTEEPRKGLGVLLAAFPQVLATYPAARLLIAGHGNAAAVRAMPADARGRVEVLGQLSDADRASLLASATVFVAPQVGGESFGVVLAEAMAAGAPIVASALPAFRAVLDGGRLGELFPVGDAGAAARSISGLLDSPRKRERLSREAVVAVQRYDWAGVVAQIEAVYEAVLPARVVGGVP
jgi:phosphatidyl-myo-inositol alpha-mannosyltransferase